VPTLRLLSRFRAPGARTDRAQRSAPPRGGKEGSLTAAAGRPETTHLLFNYKNALRSTSYVPNERRCKEAYSIALAPHLLQHRR